LNFLANSPRSSDVKLENKIKYNASIFANLPSHKWECNKNEDNDEGKEGGESGRVGKKVNLFLMMIMVVVVVVVVG
jgi:hypothetical protein